MNRKRRSISIRRSLLRSVVLLIAATAVAILAVTFIGTGRVVDDLSRSLVDQVTMHTESELRRFFEPVTRSLEIGAAWGRAGLLDPATDEAAARVLWPVVTGHRQVSAALVADDRGRELMLLERADDRVVRLTRADEWSGRSSWRELDAAGGTVREEWRELGYDPRVRPWFRGALEARHDEVFWTDPYTFFTTREPGITAAVRWQTPAQPGVRFVVGFDVALLDISRFTTGLHVSPHGRVAILAEDGRVVGLPADPRFATDAAVRAAALTPANALGHAPLADAVARWRSTGGSSERFAFTSGGDGWWAGFQPFSLGNRTLWIAVLVPEADFLGQIEHQRRWIVVIAAAAVLLSVVMAIVLARTYGRPLEQLAAGSERIRQLDLDAGPPIASRLTEVVALAEAQGKMLSALQSFARYVPTGVVRELVRQGEVAEIGGRTTQLTVLFTDIRGFAGIAERMAPSELAAHLSEYFEAMLSELRDEHATVDKLIGDAIMAFWGAPAPDPDHVVHAVKAVLRCRDRLAALNAGWRARGLPELPTCFGLDTGSVVVGNMGARERLSYTALGDTVNLASRVEGLNRVYGTELLATDDVRRHAGPGYVWRLIDVVAVKGRSQGVQVYELLGRAGEVDDATRAWARAYEEALSIYQAGRFGEATDRLRALAEQRPLRSVDRLLAECERLAASPPSDWDGVARMSTK